MHCLIICYSSFACRICCLGYRKERCSLRFLLLVFADTLYKFYVSSLLLFILSCLSKAMAVTMPLLILLAEYKITGTKRINLKRILPFLIISIIFIGINLKVGFYNIQIPVYSL